MSEITRELQTAEQRVMDGLKDFQQATVERIDTLFRGSVRRVLVSDEVGLGKTLIAKGVIAKTAVLHKEMNDSLFKVIYICSNRNIAEQNLNKLMITNNVTKETSDASRLSMQHLQIYKQENDEKIKNGYVQLIPLTPHTSFRMTSGDGIVQERALMFALLKRLPDLSDEQIQRGLEVLLSYQAPVSWHYWVKKWMEDEVIKCDDLSGHKYIADLHESLSRHLRKGQVLKELKAICIEIDNSGCSEVPKTGIIGKLRSIFAKISVDLLNPDLVIMDEFQRFEFLMDASDDSETGMLARRFFSSKQGNEAVKILLLSATPYKLYSTLEEIDQTGIDEHYREFLSVMNFLIDNESKSESFTEIWKNYSFNLREMTLGNTALIEAKNRAEDAMYENVCRTERISQIKSGNFIDDTSVSQFMPIVEDDITSYVKFAQMLEHMKMREKVPIDYVKSCPYLMSFMNHYQLKKKVEGHLKELPVDIKYAKEAELWVDGKAVSKYKAIPCRNARLEKLFETAFEKKAELLLWVPPSLPYYKSEGVYKDADSFSKILLFSSWEMVPRMIASLVSYESERRTIGYLSEKNGSELTYHRENTAQRLKFSVSGGHPRSMSMFCLIYPSKFLGECFDAIEIKNNGIKSIFEVEEKVRTCIQQRINELGIKGGESVQADQRWYYLLPLMLDDESYVSYWIENAKLVGDIKDEYEREDAAMASQGQKGFETHLEKLKELYSAELENLGRMPNDLMEVCVDMAIASPAICAYRTNTVHAAELAKSLIDRFNTLEWSAVVDCYFGEEDSAVFWKNVLKYCKDGNLQSVLDEYAHMLTDSNGLTNVKNKEESIHNLMVEGLDIRSASYNVDTWNALKKRSSGTEGRKGSSALNMRSHYAVGFYQDKGQKESGYDRKASVRNSFNSPFRPFVLASTSIGQEGLDFHYYCRKIMHWNLPSNPIDLEQREGRINRFKCLAIRKNIADKYGDMSFKTDIWNEMFDKASICEKEAGSSDLVPFWCLPNNQSVKIERIVPMYPFSQDISKYDRLLKILSLYRLTLGQTKQEDLLEYIFDNDIDKDSLKEIFIDLSPFSRILKERIEVNLMGEHFRCQAHLS
ncbi:helicase-related protein [Acetobacterium sp.]|uniref:helicase-related protein n=1 Tax=Acetobacterium sp. TaxID=1872094 RepID=UPI002F3ECF9C